MALTESDNAGFLDKNISYVPIGSHGSVDGSPYCLGFELNGGTGSFLINKYIVGTGRASISWTFNTTSALNSIDTNIDHGVREIQFYTSQQKLIGSGSVLALGSGDKFSGFISSPPPLVKFVVSSSYDMRGWCTVGDAVLHSKGINGETLGNYGVEADDPPAI